MSHFGLFWPLYQSTGFNQLVFNNRLAFQYFACIFAVEYKMFCRITSGSTGFSNGFMPQIWLPKKKLTLEQRNGYIVSIFNE